MLSSATGSVSILSVGQGDITLSFDPNNPTERIRAARIVKEMLRRGYALLVEAEIDGVKKFIRALEFREDVCQYVIADYDPTIQEAANEMPPQGEAADQPQQAAAAADEAAPKKRGRPSKNRVIDAGATRTVAVHRSAGG